MRANPPRSAVVVSRSAAAPRGGRVRDSARGTASSPLGPEPPPQAGNVAVSRGRVAGVGARGRRSPSAVA